MCSVYLYIMAELRKIECPVCYKTVTVYVSICENKHHICIECAENMCCRKSYLPGLFSDRLVAIGKHHACPLCRCGSLCYDDNVFANDPHKCSFVGNIHIQFVDGAVTFRGQRYKNRYAAVEDWATKPLVTINCWVCGAVVKQATGESEMSVLERLADQCACVYCFDCGIGLKRGALEQQHLCQSHGYSAHLSAYAVARPRRSQRLLERRLQAHVEH